MKKKDALRWQRIDNLNPGSVTDWVNKQIDIEVVSVLLMNISTGYFLIYYYDII